MRPKSTLLLLFLLLSTAFVSAQYSYYPPSSYSSYGSYNSHRPTFNPNNAYVSAQVSSNGSISVRVYGATHIGTFPSSFGTVRSRTRRTLTVVLRVPWGYSNSGRYAYKTVTAYQDPPARPVFNPSSFRAYASVSTSGSVSVRGYGASVARYSPSSFGTVSSPTRIKHHRLLYRSLGL